jgi:hypothetical protein
MHRSLPGRRSVGSCASTVDGPCRALVGWPQGVESSPCSQLGKLRSSVADAGADLGGCSRCGLAGLGSLHRGSPLFPVQSGALVVRQWCDARRVPFAVWGVQACSQHRSAQSWDGSKDVALSWSPRALAALSPFGALHYSLVGAK